jgi:ATP/maltotriose-dependent transcriptional regulator MalT
VLTDESRDRGRAVPQPKTIESHLRNTFHKLGIKSRVELARAVERADRMMQALPR